MKNMKQLLKNLIAEESGQDLIEYALVAEHPYQRCLAHGNPAYVSARRQRSHKLTP